MKLRLKLSDLDNKDITLFTIHCGTLNRIGDMFIFVDTVVDPASTPLFIIEYHVDTPRHMKYPHLIATDGDGYLPLIFNNNYLEVCYNNPIPSKTQVRTIIDEFLRQK